jgi:hypothetical protein
MVALSLSFLFYATLILTGWGGQYLCAAATCVLCMVFYPSKHRTSDVDVMANSLYLLCYSNPNPGAEARNFFSGKINKIFLGAKT